MFSKARSTTVFDKFSKTALDNYCCGSVSGLCKSLLHLLFEMVIKNRREEEKLTALMLLGTSWKGYGLLSKKECIKKGF